MENAFSLMVTISSDIAMQTVVERQSLRAKVKKTVCGGANSLTGAKWPIGTHHIKSGGPSQNQAAGCGTRTQLPAPGEIRPKSEPTQALK